MYFLVLFQPTGERAIYQNEISTDKLTVKDLIDWIHVQFHFERSSGEGGNRCLSLLYDNTELQAEWFLQDINIRFGSTVKCIVKEGDAFVFYIRMSRYYNQIDVSTSEERIY
jgi:hypothetical protein